MAGIRGDLQPSSEVAAANSTALELYRPAEERAAEFIRASKAPSTVRGYQADWRDFTAWCAARQTQSLPALPKTVAAYIADCAQRLKPGSIQRRLNAIAEAHKATGHESPCSAGLVRNVFKGIRRELGTAVTQKAAVLTEEVRRMAAAADPGLIGTRDRAIVLLGFAGALRRSEIVGLDVRDLEFVPEGLALTIRRSKTDQEGAGRRIGICHGEQGDTCPVAAMTRWLDEAAIKSGAVFRAVTRNARLRNTRLSGIDVARIVKKLAERVGLDPAKYAGHSLRAGHVTQAAIAEVPDRIIQSQTRHNSLEMVQRYKRDANLFRKNSSKELGL